MLSIFNGVKGKMILLVLIPILALAGLMYLSFSTLNNQIDVTVNIGKQDLPQQVTLMKIRNSVNSIMRFTWAAILQPEGSEGRKVRIKKAQDRVVKFDTYIAKVKKYTTDTDQIADVELVATKWGELKPHLDKALDNLVKGDEVNAKKILSENVSEQSGKFTADLDGIGDRWEKRSEDDMDKAEKEAASKKITMLLSSLVAGLFTAIFGVYLALTLSKQLASVSSRVSEVGEQVLTASEQLSSASQNLSSSATESASSLEETVSALEELSSTVKMNADNAKEAAALSATTNSVATEGEREIKNLISAMGEIATGSKKIEEIINVIDDIAFQTNLLALNAAVEAARAGEQGKGFAVVAEAVRALAQRSASAAKDITSLIKESVEKSERGSTMADKSGTVLQNIVNSIKKVSDLNNEIATASQEQSRGIGQISKAMNELDQSTQKNAALAEEVAASGEELSAQALSMQENVKDLNHIVTGDRAAASLSENQLQNSDHRQHTYSAERKSSAHHGSKKVVQMATRSHGHSNGRSNGKGTHNMEVKASNVIPFDDDMDSIKKVGTAENF